MHLLPRLEERSEGSFELEQVVLALGELDFRCGEVYLGGEQREVLAPGFNDHVFDGALSQQDWVDAAAFLLFDAEPAGCVGLGVEVDEEGGNLLLSQPPER